MAARPKAPPYVSFRTFLGLFDRMREEGIPDVIDDTWFPKELSMTYRGQFRSALRDFGFIQKDGTPTADLTAAVSDAVKQKEIIRAAVERHYPLVLALGTRASQGQLEQAFKDVGIQGSTFRKAVAFYLDAARYAGIPLSPYFKTPQRPARSSAQPPPKWKPRPPKEKEKPAGEEDGGLVVTLGSGGTVTLTADVNWLSLSESDRKFVFGLVDQMKGYPPKELRDFSEPLDA